MAAPNGDGLSQVTSSEGKQPDRESSLGKVRPGSGSLHAVTLCGKAEHGEEGLALRGTTGLEEAAKDSSSYYLRAGLGCRGNGLWQGGGRGEEEGAGIFFLGNSWDSSIKGKEALGAGPQAFMSRSLQSLAPMDLFILAQEIPLTAALSWPVEHDIPPCCSPSSGAGMPARG